MKTVYENSWFKIIQDGKYHYLHEDASANGAVILVEQEDNFILIKIRRPAHQCALIEAPRGYANPGETSFECAKRELLEETGFAVDDSLIKKIGKVKPNTAILTSTIDIFLASIKIDTQASDTDNEAEGLIYIAKSKIKDEIRKGNITDGFTLSALAYYWATK